VITFLTKGEEMIYVMHVCKNSKLKTTDPNYCDRAWVDEDLHNAKSIPPTWKYCEECVKKGFKNPKRKKCTRTPEQIEAFKQRMKEYRERLKCQENKKQ
jgi:hypothetical protein